MDLGRLFLIPTVLTDNAPLETLSLEVKKAIDRITYFIVENEKTARRFIKKINPEKEQASLHINVLNKFTQDDELSHFLAPCLNGADVGIISESGCPAIADPGATVVNLAHEKNISIIPLTGPSSIILAMMSSGMNGQHFAFNGYLPIDKQERKKVLKRLERLSYEQQQSQIFIETPYRNNKTLELLSQYLHANTKICVACDITLPTAFIKTKTAKQWQNQHIDLHKRPCIFIIHKFY